MLPRNLKTNQTAPPQASFFCWSCQATTVACECPHCGVETIACYDSEVLAMVEQINT